MKSENKIAKEKPCTAAQMTMVTNYMSGWTRERSFKAAFPDRYCDSAMVSREFAKQEVKDEIERQQELLREASKSQIKDLTLLWSREKATQTYMGLIEGAQKRMENIDNNSRDYAALSKVVNDAATSLGKMLGYDAPIRVDADSRVTVTFDAGPDGDQSAGEDDWTG